MLRIELKYVDGKVPVVSGLKRISKPGLRVYAPKTDIPRVLGGLGIVIVSTVEGDHDRRARPSRPSSAARSSRTSGRRRCPVSAVSPSPSPPASTSTLDGRVITVKGPKGDAHPTLAAAHRRRARRRHARRQPAHGDQARQEPPRADPHARQQHGRRRHRRGTARASRSSASATARRRTGEKLALALGYSHPIEIDPPAGISFEVENPTRLAVVGIDKELVGQIAAKVRATRKPEPYKGKGVRYAGEKVRRKAGKAGKIGGKK